MAPYTLRAFEDNPDDTEEAQIAFVSALTAFRLRPCGYRHHRLWLEEL
jgi:hypothetical protein